jgi:hypothetical protein
MKFLTNIDLSKNQLLNAAMHGSAAAPTTPTEGQLYFNTSDKQMYFWNSTAWVNSASPDLSAYIAKAIYDPNSILIATADNTPIVLPIGTSTVVGRGPTGDISALAIDSDLSSTSAAHDTIPSALAVKTYADGLIVANNAMVYKGTVGSGGTHTIAAFNALATYSIGWTYKVIEAGTIKGTVCEIGDMVIAIVARAGSGQVDADWTKVQANIDGAVTGPASVTSTGNIATFNGTSGKIIQDGTVTIASLQNQNATHTGDVTGATVLTIAPSSVNLSKMAALPTNTIIGNNTAGTATPIALTATQLRTLLNVADGATANIGTVRSAAFLVGDNTTTTFTPLTHSFNTRNINVQIYESVSPWSQVQADIEVVSVNAITVKFAVAPLSTAQYNVVVMG